MNDTMPKEIFAPDITEGSNNVLCQIDKRHESFHTKYIRKDPDTVIISKAELEKARNTLEFLQAHRISQLALGFGMDGRDIKEDDAYDKASKSIQEIDKLLER